MHEKRLTSDKSCLFFSVLTWTKIKYFNVLHNKVVLPIRRPS